MANKYLDDDGTLYFWQKIKNKFATLASPTFTGTPTAPTASAGTNDTQIATTAFVAAAVNNIPSYSDFTGATASAAGTHGLVPAPAAGDNGKYLKGNKTWDTIDGDDVLITSVSGTYVTGTSTLHGSLATLDGAVANVEGRLVGKQDAFTSQAANQVFAGPASGSAATPAFRSLVAADIPNLNTSKLNAGTLGVARGGTGVGTITGIVKGNGTSAMSAATASDVVSLLGTTAVNRATADASGNNIANTYAKKTDISGMYKYKGSVASESALPASPATGDVYNIESASTYGGAGANVAWNGSAWDSLGEIFQITAITNAEIDTIVAS